MKQAYICAVSVVAAHEGVADLLVTIRFPNGGSTEMTLDRNSGEALMDICCVSSAEHLVGQPWDKVRDALLVSFKRFG